MRETVRRGEGDALFLNLEKRRREKRGGDERWKEEIERKRCWNNFSYTDAATYCCNHCSQSKYNNNKNERSDDVLDKKRNAFYCIFPFLPFSLSSLLNLALTNDPFL